MTTVEQDTAFVRGSEYRRGALFRLQHGPLTPTDIAKHTNLHRPHVSRAMRQMEERGLVELTSPGEHRHEYALTDRGREVLQRFAREVKP